jgi:hypothetical protein
MAASHDQNDLFVQLSENRLQQSLARISATDNRALGVLGLVAVLMTGVWAVYGNRHQQHVAAAHDSGLMIGFALGFLFLAMICAGMSLLFTAQFDNPDLGEFYEKYYASPKTTYTAYFPAVVMAIRLNNAVVRRKTTWLLSATVSLFLSVLVIIVSVR